jgi:phospholipid-binding lipoprotein MlaA
MRQLLSAAIRIIPFLLPTFMLSACAHDSADLAANDPAAPTNRTVFGGNMFVDRHVIKPVARFYVADIPVGAQHGVHHFVANLGEPQILINDVLQGNFSRSWNTLQRFTINTTVGGLGLFDVAQGWGLPRHNADFGQTLGVWGVGTGPDVQLPLFGFSNVRDMTGKGISIVANPLSLVGGAFSMITGGAKSGLGVLDDRVALLPVTDSVEKTSLDRYATFRSMMDQHRAAFIQDGREGKVRPAKSDIAVANNMPVHS